MSYNYFFDFFFFLKKIKIKNFGVATATPLAIWGVVGHPHLAGLGVGSHSYGWIGATPKEILGVVLVTPKILNFWVSSRAADWEPLPLWVLFDGRVRSQCLLFRCWKQGWATWLDEQLEEHPV
jgi:hypothetical protein